MKFLLLINLCLHFFINTLSMGNIIDTNSDIFPGTNKLNIIQYTGVYFKDIIGQNYVKKQLNECINFMNNPKEYYKYEYKMPRGILFVGPPGTGKTMMARALATEAAINFISVTASDFENAFYGSGPKNIRKLFRTAKHNAPCIIYIDEMDSISSRSNFKSYDKSDLINTLLSELDGFDKNSNILVIAATNNPNKIDPAVLRSGRFDKEIVFDLPNAAERKEYFETINKKFFSKDFLDNYDHNIATLTKYTTGLSLADLSNIINCAKSRFLERISIMESPLSTLTTTTTTTTNETNIEIDKNTIKEPVEIVCSDSENIKKDVLEVTTVVEEIDELENHDKLSEEIRKNNIQRSRSDISSNETHSADNIFTQLDPESEQLQSTNLLKTTEATKKDKILSESNYLINPISTIPDKFTKKLFAKHWKTLDLPNELFPQVYKFMKTHKIKDYNFILNVLYKFSLENQNKGKPIDQFTDKEHEYFDLELLMFECKDSDYSKCYVYKNFEKITKKKNHGFFSKLNKLNLDENNDIAKLGVIKSNLGHSLNLYVKDIDGKKYNLNNHKIVESLLQRYLSQLSKHKCNALASYINHANIYEFTLWQLQAICDRYSNHTIKLVQNENFTDGITFNDLNESLDILIVGMAKKERLMTAEEKMVVAYHEVGHALMGYLISGGEVPIKISIIPSGRNALGYTKHYPKDKHIVSFEDYVAQIYCLLGGRCCELLIFNKLYSGANDDLSKIDRILDLMICEHNMYSSFGFIKSINGEYNVSDKVKYRIERFKRKLIKMYSKMVKDYLSEYKEDVHRLAKLLVEREELTEADLTEENLSPACITNKGKLVVSTKYINL